MVEGCRELAKKFPLYFLTITCRGKEISHEYAEENYGKWTNSLLDACRLQTKRDNREWHYVQVTERQKRLHPHSHFVTTFLPKGSLETSFRKWKVAADKRRIYRQVYEYRSAWFSAALERSGLGTQYNITRISDAEAASRYVAKYLFKPSIFSADWPKGWKRIRYSNSFPKMAEKETIAIALITQEDWYKLASKALFVTVENLDDFQEAGNRLHFHDTIVRLKTKK